jgi:hypothetical protein
MNIFLGGHHYGMKICINIFKIGLNKEVNSIRVKAHPQGLGVVFYGI